jgi:hypothetical protein
VRPWMRAHPEAKEGLQTGERPSGEKARATRRVLPIFLDPKMSSRDYSGTYGPRKYTTASIPMATSAMKIRAPTTTLSPVSR